MSDIILQKNYCASGSRTDFRNLLENYEAGLHRYRDQKAFHVFALVWGEFDFYRIFYGRKLNYDRAIFTDELFRIVMEELERYVERYENMKHSHTKPNTVTKISFYIFLTYGKQMSQKFKTHNYRGIFVNRLDPTPCKFKTIF